MKRLMISVDITDIDMTLMFNKH